MNAATRRGISDHAMVEHFERLIQRFTRQPWQMTEHEAIYQAAYCTLRLAGIQHDHARQDAREISRVRATP